MKDHQEIPEGHSLLAIRSPRRGDRYLETDGKVHIAARPFNSGKMRKILRCDDWTKERNALGWEGSHGLRGFEEWISELGHRIFFNDRRKWTLLYESGQFVEFESDRNAMRYAAEFPL